MKESNTLTDTLLRQEKKALLEKELRVQNTVNKVPGKNLVQIYFLSLR